MQMHTIRTTHPRQRPIRVGRGGKRGTYSGRGMKGQKARGKNKIRPAIRDFIKQTPKLRGEEFPALLRRRRNVIIIRLEDMQGKFSPGDAVTPKTLSARGLLPTPKHPVKLLGVGESPPKLLIRGVAVSKSAREKIYKAGGTVEGPRE